MATAQDILKQLRGNYDESTGYSGAANANDILKNYFAGGGTTRDLTNNLTDENGNSTISQDLFNKLLNNYYSTVPQASLNSPQAFQAATGNPFGLNTANTIGELPIDEQGVNIPTPQGIPKGYVPFNAATDTAQIQHMGGSVLDPNNVINVNGLTYTPRSNLNIPKGGDFLSKFGPALAIAGFGGAAALGGLPGEGAGLVGGASGGGSLAGAAGGGGALSGADAGASALTEFLGGGSGAAGAGAAAAGAAGGGASLDGGSTLSNLFGSTLFKNPLTGGNVTLGSLLGNSIPNIANYILQSGNAKDMQDAIQKATQLSEPFASQYPFYQNLLKSVWSDPSFFANNPATQAGAAILQRQNAKLGHLYSGNALGDLGNYLATNQINYSNALAPLAGATIAPGYTGTNFLNGTQTAQNINNQGIAGLAGMFGLNQQTSQNSGLNNTLSKLSNQLGNYLQNIGGQTMNVA